MIRNIVMAIIMLFPFSTVIQAAPETYILDENHSYVLWHISHFGFSSPSGKWLANGTLILDEAKPQDSKISVTIKTADVVTGIKELDEHLRDGLFFDTLKYPTATFLSDKIVITGKSTAKVHGMLTVHGVAKPIVLDVTLNKLGISPISNKKTAGFSATTTINRSDFGINTLLPGLGDKVSINIESEAAKK